MRQPCFGRRKHYLSSRHKVVGHTVLFAGNVMAEAKSVFDQVDAEIEARAIAEAETEIDAGKGVPHAKVREWLLKLAKGEIAPPPCR